MLTWFVLPRWYPLTLDLRGSLKYLLKVNAIMGADCSGVTTAILENVAVPNGVMMVHDAARPCISVQTLRMLIDHAISNDVGTVLAQASTDTLKRISLNGRVTETLDRRVIWRAQTPQIFRRSDLELALSSALSEYLPITDESTAMELSGFPVSVLEGPATNIKVTLPIDLAFAEIILRQLAEENQL